MAKKTILALLLLMSVSVSKAQVINEENPEAIDSTPGSPPLETDDTGTPGPYGVEANFIGNCDFIEKGKTCGLGLDLNLGFGERTQLRLQRQTLQEANSGQATFYGYGATELGIKYRFYDFESWKLALYPSFQFDDDTYPLNPDGSKGISQGRAFYLPLLVSKQIGENTFVANIGYSNNQDYTDKSFIFTSLAIGRAVTDNLRLMAEMTSEKSKLGRTTTLRTGLVREFSSVKNDFFEKALFASLGRTLGSTEDSQTHTFLLIGFTLATKAH